MSAWPFRRRPPRIGFEALWARFFQPVVPVGHASLEAFESAIAEEERALLAKTLGKLALDAVERILRVRGKEIDPDRSGIAFLDAMLDPGVRENLARDQDPSDPRNLFRVAVTEFGCAVGEIFVRTGKGRWEPRRAPNLWRSAVRRPDGSLFDPFRAVVRQLSDDREPGALLKAYDASPP